MHFLVGLGLAASLSHLAVDDSFPHYHTIGFAPFTNLPVLGSQDERVGFYLNYQAIRPEKRLTVSGIPLKLALESYVTYSYGGGWRFRPRDQSVAIGFLALARFERIGPSRKGFYYEMGWGMQYASRRTWDLNTYLNSTPVFGVGTFYAIGKDSFGYVGLRWMHISNAGTVGSNQGQNQLLLMTGFKI